MISRCLDWASSKNTHDMKITEAIAQHFYEVHYGDSWTDVAMKDVLKDISRQQAIQKIGDTNTIAVLVHHMNFYNTVVYDRCFGEQHEFNHEDSFVIEINNEEDWLRLQKNYFENVERIHQAILSMDEEKLFTVRSNNQNTFYKNLHGLIEHIHYHLGQLSLLKKIILSMRSTA
jgi:hypothetical protein